MLAALDITYGLGGLAAFVLALIFVGRAMRADAAKRLDAYTARLERTRDQLEGRVRTLESKWARGERRRYQLEAILRAAGIPIPPWPNDDDDTTPGAIALIPRQRSAS